MSRIGKLPVAIPDKVTVQVDGSVVKVQGPKGSLEKSFDCAVSITIEDDTVKINPASNSRLSKALHGTARAIINNMVYGVINGYTKNLEIVGVGFRATVKGKVLDLNLGYSHPIEYTIPEGITVTVTENTKVNVSGLDKELVGQVAADIKHYYPVEPYKGKGVRIVGEFVRRKEGKKTA
jgi:large subunit ribosomal protein L6